MKIESKLMNELAPMTFRAYGNKDIDRIPQFQKLSSGHRLAIKSVSAVLPFRVNNYVVEQLIDWDDIPSDPIFQLTIPQPEMLDPADLARMQDLIHRAQPAALIRAEARRIQMSLNPHPAGQMELNVPIEVGKAVRGIQHKYRETALFFPAQGQTCHAYCTYCFRWAQFVGIDDLRFAAREAGELVDYLHAHPEVTDVLITGGDPMIMKTSVLRRYIEPLLSADLPSLTSIRFGTKAPAYWPYRFLCDPDADDLMRLFEEVVASGKHLAVMAHVSHYRELETPAAAAALRRIRATGAVIRCQAPLIRHVNDRASVWSRMWHEQVKLGAIPYYMFVERDTGPKGYFQVPLYLALRIFQDAFKSLSGLSRTVRGPSMSCTPGKVLIDGIMEVAGQPVFVLKLLQARDPRWVNELFFAEYDERAAWLDELRPAFGDSEFFFEAELERMKASRRMLVEHRMLEDRVPGDGMPN